VIDIVRFDHISQAAPDGERQVELLERLFGFRYAGRFEEEAFFGFNLAVPGSSQMGWEVLAPNGPDSYLRRFLDGEHGPGLHHVAIQVRDLGQTLEALRAQGIEPWGVQDPRGGIEGESGESHDAQEARGVAYIHPRRGGQGFLFQLYEGQPWHEVVPFEDGGELTLGIKAIDHLSHAHPDRAQLAEWYERVFGLQTVRRSPEVNGQSDYVTQVLETPTRQLRWEILQPTAAESFVQRFIDQRGPAMHHVTFEVHDFERALAACRHHGAQTFGLRDGGTEDARWREAFIHPRDTGGVLVQFFWESEPGAWT
jgi:methylmalonyl-CoA epimerase